jgi:glutamyl/glutaminyl-tRNA synthetase
MQINVRIAPSPTGNLHIGTARTALFNWLFARHHGGRFILRIEDTDLERSSKEYEHNITDGLRWLGLDWDNEQLYRQTERLPLYREALQRLLDTGRAVWKEYTQEELAKIAAEGRTARDKVIVLVDDGDPEREIVFRDEIRGSVAVQAKHIGQVVLAKDLDTPLYNFAVVVDDIDMDITHVIRGEDHISNTPKQILIYQALGAKLPLFAHLPLILGSDRSKMSKRHGATSIIDYQKDYLPEALVNFMGFLGYTYDGELLTPTQMAQQFELGNVHKSGAIFDVAKLNWYNTQYIRRMDAGMLKSLIGKQELPDAAVPIMTERLERLTDIEQFSYFWEEPTYDASLLTWKQDSGELTRKALSLCAHMADDGILQQDRLDAAAAEYFAGSKGSIYWPLRVALSGLKNSAGPLDIAAVIGPERVRRRIAAALAMLS